MIASVNGTISQIAPDAVVVSIGGFGVQVHVTESTAYALRINEHVELHTVLVVREDSLTLYGFVTLDERATFELAMGVSGVGPKIALGLVGAMTPAEFRAAIAHENISALTKIPGIGRKGAERMILELRDKVGAQAAASVSSSWQGTVASGLESLGWSPAQSDAAIRAVASSVNDDNPDIAAALRLALQYLDSA